MPSIAVAQKTDGSSQLARDWKRLATPSLTVVGNARESDLRRAGTEMERFRRALGSFSSSLRLDSPVPTTVVVFRDDAAFTPFKPRFRGKVNDNVAGDFSSREHANYLVMAPSGQHEFTMRVIFHEYTHYIVSRNIKRIPGWLNEGLAEFYSTFAGSDVDGRTIIGRPIDYHVARLTTQPMMPLAKFMSPTAVAELRRDIHGVQLYYAQSWALTHYLLIGNQGGRRRQLAQLLSAVNAGVSSERAFVETFGPDLTVIDRELLAHIRQFKLPAIMLPPDTSTLDAEATRMREVEAQQLQADLLLGTGAYDLSEKHVTKALSLDPTTCRHDSRGPCDSCGRIASTTHSTSPALRTSRPRQTSWPHFVRAEALRAAGRSEAAITAYRQAISLRAELAYAYLGSAWRTGNRRPRRGQRHFRDVRGHQPGPGWYRARQLEAMRLALDDFVVSDSMNVVRQMGCRGRRRHLRAAAGGNHTPACGQEGRRAVRAVRNRTAGNGRLLAGIARGA